MFRQLHEAAMLSSLRKLPPVNYQGVTVSTPALYHHNKETATLVISDYPESMEFKKYMTKHVSSLHPEPIQRLGVAIGKCLKNFHIWTAADSQKELRDVMQGNQAMKQLKWYVNYGRLEATIEKFPELLEGSRKLFQEIATTLKQEADDGTGALIHGDFWTGK